MRQIKFRVWDIRFNRMVPWEDVRGTGLFEDALDGRDSVLMQFTGLVDKNGKEIYEGDYIKYVQALFNTMADDFPTKIKRVLYYEYSGKFNVYETNAGESDIEVVGNIYENPNL